MLLFMIYNDEASYASTSSSSRLVSPLTSRHHRESDIRLHYNTENSIRIVERKYEKVRFNLLPSSYEDFFFLLSRKCLSTRAGWRQKSSSGGKSSFHSSPFTLWCESIVKELKFSIKNPIWRISFFHSFLDIFHNPVNLILNVEAHSMERNMNILRRIEWAEEKKVMIKKEKKIVGGKKFSIL